jgi:adenine-specific DNA-methyltransferase
MPNTKNQEQLYDQEKKTNIILDDCEKFLDKIPQKSLKLIITSPPYNIGKEYEKKSSVEYYFSYQKRIIEKCYKALADDGSICWQVGNYVEKSSIIPLDILLSPIFSELGMKMRNRIIWHFEHGLHCSKRYSGRYETIMWFTKGDNYTFNLDPVRVPQKYPGKKYFKGPKAGMYSCNPLGKNPGDVWMIPNVKNNHVEKTEHPCQFPVELVERFVLSLTNKGDVVFDPFMGVGSSVIAAIKNGRKGVGCEIDSKYFSIANIRINQELNGVLKTRPMNKPIHDPTYTKSSFQNQLPTLFPSDYKKEISP